jgi:adenosylmethionine---8-amino-7-oxononanoate aminotransferase
MIPRLSLIERDRAAIWHPYTQAHTASSPIPIISGKGSYLFDEQGKRYIDAISSWWVTLHGHAHPYIAEQVGRQFDKLEQVIFAGFTHLPAIELAERLLKILPVGQDKIFYSDNGSTAVEVALKMCLQYWYNKGAPRKKILAFEHGYHGDTFGAMAVSGRSAWTAPFSSLLFDVLYIPVPTLENIEATKLVIKQHCQDIACFIFEPLVQGSAGMLMHSVVQLDELLVHCRNCDILLIQDEVFTGFGRTGKIFAADHLVTKPDLVCLSKGLTGGTMPFGITSCCNQIYEAFLSEDLYKTLFHGHSFTANPLACVAALASLDLLETKYTQDNIGRIDAQHKGFSAEMSDEKKILNIRQCGTILAFDWYDGSHPSYFSALRNKLYHYFLDRGILLRPLGNTLYLVPPYCTSEEDLNYIYGTIKVALTDL